MENLFNSTTYKILANSIRLTIVSFMEKENTNRIKLPHRRTSITDHNYNTLNLREINLTKEGLFLGGLLQGKRIEISCEDIINMTDLSIILDAIVDYFED